MIEAHVKAHYPNAVRSSVFRNQAFAALERELGLPLHKVLLATSICSDDIVWVSDAEGPAKTHRATRDLLGPFELGGLAGLPFTGITGMAAYAQHIPDGGAGCIVYGPHIGITDDGLLGQVVRPGQQAASSACGALVLAVQRLQTMPNDMPTIDEDDPQETLLQRRLLPHSARFRSDPTPLKVATDVVYEIIHQLVYRYARAVKHRFPCERIVLIGGVIINTSPEHEDYFDVRDRAVLRVAEL